MNERQTLRLSLVQLFASHILNGQEAVQSAKAAEAYIMSEEPRQDAPAETADASPETGKPTDEADNCDCPVCQLRRAIESGDVAPAVFRILRR